MKQIFQELRKSLLKLFFISIYKPKPRGRATVVFNIILLFFIGPGGIILVGKLLLHPLGIQIIIAVTSYLFLAGNLIIIWVSALVKGAELTLENPPAPGETWVRVIDGNDEIFKGDKIVPIIKTPQPSAATIEISPVRLPTRPSDLQDWKRTWPLIKPLWEEKHYNYIKISSWLHSMHPDLPFSTKTIREIIIAGKRGLLD